MPKWYFSKERLLNRTPSRANGVDLETETRYRREGCRFIMDVGNKLGLRYDTMATGVIYFHRFYMKQSFKTFPRWVTACACLFLAGKVEETPKKCRDIIKVAKSMLSDHHFLMFGENPREEVMMYERVLLQTIKFDLQVDHPYAILLKIGKLLKGDKGKIQKLVQMAWTFVNDSLSTNLCLRRKPEVLAIAHLHLAGRLSSFDLKSSTDSPSNKPWWLAFNKECQESVVEEICDEMLELYGGKKKEKPVKTKEKIIAEKGDPSPNNSSTTSSPSVTNSPPFKKKKMSKSSEPGKSPVVTCAVAVVPQSGTAESKPRPVSAESKPLPLASISSAEPPVVENVSPAVTSDSLPVANPICISQTTTTTMCSAASNLVSQSSTNQTNTVSTQSVVPPSQVPAGSLVNPVVQQHSFLSATYTAASYGIISQGLGTESVIPASTNSSYLQPTPQIDNMYAVPTNNIPAPQNPSNFGQTFPNVPPRLPISSHQAPPQVQPHQPPLHTHQPPPQPPPQPHHLPPQTHQPPPQPHQLPPQPPIQTHQCPPQPPHQPPPQAHQPPPQPRQLYQHPHTLPPQQNVPPIALIPHVMNTQMPPAVPGSNNPNWHSVYSRPPPNNQPMGGGGGWLR